MADLKADIKDLKAEINEMMRELIADLSGMDGARRWSAATAMFVVSVRVMMESAGPEKPKREKMAADIRELLDTTLDRQT